MVVIRNSALFLMTTIRLLRALTEATATVVRTYSIDNRYSN